MHRLITPFCCLGAGASGHADGQRPTELDVDLLEH